MSRVPVPPAGGPNDLAADFMERGSILLLFVIVAHGTPASRLWRQEIFSC